MKPTTRLRLYAGPVIPYLAGWTVAHHAGLEPAFHLAVLVVVMGVAMFQQPSR